MDMETSEQITKLACSVALKLDDKKAKDVMLINISKLSNLGDYFILATAQNTVHAKAMAGFIEEELMKAGRSVFRRDGVSEGRWAVLDYGEIIIHIFTEELRQFYHLEKLWIDGKNVTRIADIKRKKEVQAKAKDKQKKLDAKKQTDKEKKVTQAKKKEEKKAEKKTAAETPVKQTKIKEVKSRQPKETKPVKEKKEVKTAKKETAKAKEKPEAKVKK